MTLPTRQDGGIDYNFLAEKMGYSNGDEVLAFMRLAAAHTRERCAKICFSVTYPYPTKESEDYRRGYHDGCSDAEAEICKMED